MDSDASIIIKDDKKYNFEDINNKTDELYNEELESAIEYLNCMKDYAKLFTSTNLNSYNAVIFIGKTIAYNYKQSIIDFIVRKGCEKFLSNLLLHFYSISHELNFAIESDLTRAEQSVEVKEKQINILSLVLYITNILAQSSLQFIINFGTANGIKAHFLFLKDKKFLEKNLESRILIWNKSINMIEYLLMNISSFSKTCDDNQEMWSHLDSVNTLLNVSRVKETCTRDAYVAIINIANDKQMDSLDEMNEIKSVFLGEIKQCFDDFNTNRFSRVNRQFNFNDSTVSCAVHCITQKNQTVTSIIIILRALYRLAINGKMKSQLFCEDNLVGYLKCLLTKGNTFEIYFTLEVLAQLTFDLNAANVLAGDSDLQDLLAKLKAKDTKKFSDSERKVHTLGVLKYLEQINWNLNVTKSGSLSSMGEESSEAAKLEKLSQVFVSFNMANKEICFKIKDYLETSMNLTVFLTDHTNSTVSSMSENIKQSICILLLISEKYRQSVLNQIESQYAFRLNKKILPIIIQDGYEYISGWMSIIMGDKILINFQKYELNECFQQIKHEIKACQEESNQTRASTTLTTSHTLGEGESTGRRSSSASHHHHHHTSSSSVRHRRKSSSTLNATILKWSAEECKDWFTKNNINVSLYEYLEPCSGVVLNQIYDMKCNAPEFYYQAMSKTKNANISSISLFTFHLCKLFETTSTTST